MSVLIVVFIVLLSWSSLHFHKEVHSDTSIIKYLRLIFLHVNTLCMLATICLNWPLCAYVCVVLSRLQSEVTDKLRFTTFYFYFALVVCELVLCCFNEKPPLFSNVVTDPVSGTLLQTCSAESMECVCVFMLYSISCALCWLRMFNVLSSFKSQCVFLGLLRAGSSKFHTHTESTVLIGCSQNMSSLSLCNLSVLFSAHL